MHTKTSSPLTVPTATTTTSVPSVTPAVPGLVALDVDGTIVKTGQKIPAQTVQATRDVVDAGHHLVLSTGRSPAGALEVVGQLGLRHGFIVLSSGAAIARIETNLVTRRPRLVIQTQSLFDPASVLMRALGAAPDALLAVEDTRRGGWLVNQRFERGRLSGRQRRVRREHALWNVPTTRAVVHADSIGGLVYDLACCGATVTPAGDDWLNLTPKNVSKASGLERVRVELGVDERATIAIGDALEDLPAFEWAQTAVAMGNASQQVRSAAHYVTGHVDEHGAAQALRTLVAA